jgi:undecaprenyl-phosphate glucose phosphotransferase
MHPRPKATAGRSWSRDPLGDVGRLEFIREHIKALPVAARLLPDIRDALTEQLCGLCASARSSHQDPEGIPQWRERLVKRGMDIVVAAVALVFFLPVMALTAIAIGLDGPGPVIFRQHRKGFNGKHFVLFKSGP